MNPGPRSLRAALLPGMLTSGQTDRVVRYIEARTGLRGGLIWAAFVHASKHAAADAAAYRHATTAQPLETRIRELAAELSAPLTIAAFVLAYAAGLRLGLDFGRSNVIRERAERNARRREREAEAPPPFDPVRAQEEFTAARSWAQRMGKAARNHR